MKPSHQVGYAWYSWGPRFEHGCEACTWLGHFDVFDLWLCTVVPTYPVLQARWESEETQRVSASAFSVLLFGTLSEAENVPGPDSANPVDARQKYALRVAYLVARDRGLLRDTDLWSGSK